MTCYVHCRPGDPVEFHAPRASVDVGVVQIGELRVFLRREQIESLAEQLRAHIDATLSNVVAIR